MKLPNGFTTVKPCLARDGYPCEGLMSNGEIRNIVYVGEYHDGAFQDLETEDLAKPVAYRPTRATEAWIQRQEIRKHGDWHV